MDNSSKVKLEWKVKCNWRKCAHGMGLGSKDLEACYVSGADPNDENCPCFITDDDYEAGMKAVRENSVNRTQ